MKKKNNIFDLSKLKYDSGGVTNFYWPLNTSVSTKNFNYLVKNLMPFVLEHYPDYPEVRAIKVFSKWFIVDVLKLLDATILNKNFIDDDVTPVLPDNYIILKSLTRKSEIKCNTFTKPLIKKSKVYFYVKNLIKEIIWNYKINKMNILCVNKDKIKSFKYSSLIKSHAKNRSVWLKPIDLLEYFNDFNTDYVKLKKNKLEQFENIINIIDSSFQDVGYELNSYGRNYLYTWLDQAVSFLTQMSIKKEEIMKKFVNDKEIWFLSGGSTVYDAAFSDLLRSNNIKVVTHDHGSGNVHCEQTFMHWVEFIHSDCFIQFNNLSAQIRKNSIKKEFLLGNNPPEIKSINDFVKAGRKNIQKNNYHVVFPIKSIMYVPGAMHAEGQRMNPIIHDLTYFDWQIRLVTFLKKKDLDISIKPHPEGRTKMPLDFAKKMGIHEIKGKFEKIKANVDAYLIDFIFSSTTPSILSSNKPVIFIDRGYPVLTEESLIYIKKRCYYIKAKYTNDSRLDINWDELNDKLNIIDHRIDMTISNTYFENC